ncbi:MAG: LamG domain-containing protein, partial [Acidobacteria bacterium]|nr:LamG domain-containing protein [Acidobacteriota bacterium]
MMKRRDFGRSKLTFTFNSLSWLLAVLLLALWPWTGAMAQTCVAPPSGLVSWWPGEGNANDIQGTNNGTITGTTFATGKVGQAFSFDGNDYVQVLDSASLEPAKVTLDAWVKRSGSPGTYRYIVTKGGYDCSNASYALYTGGGGGLQFYISPAPGSFRLSPAALTSQVWDGNWHHVAGTYDGTSVRLYLDGAEIGSGTATTVSIGYSFPNDDFYMGRFGISSCLSGLYFSGQIDEVEVFNRALSASEISAIYNAGSAGKCTWIQVGIDIKPGSFPNS